MMVPAGYGTSAAAAAGPVVAEPSDEYTVVSEVTSDQPERSTIDNTDLGVISIAGILPASGFDGRWSLAVGIILLGIGAMMVRSARAASR